MKGEDPKENVADLVNVLSVELGAANMLGAAVAFVGLMNMSFVFGKFEPNRLLVGNELLVGIVDADVALDTTLVLAGSEKFVVLLLSAAPKAGGGLNIGVSVLFVPNVKVKEGLASVVAGAGAAAAVPKPNTGAEAGGPAATLVPVLLIENMLAVVLAGASSFEKTELVVTGVVTDDTAAFDEAGGTNILIPAPAVKLKLG